MQRESMLIGLAGFGLGAAVGATIMYLYDPETGNRRRALVRDQVDHARKVTGESVDRRSRDLRNRTQGMAHEMGRKLRGHEEVDDRKLEARVRERLGRTVSNPSSIVVSAQSQRVTLSGPVLTGEVDDLLDEVASVPGVREVRNLLQVHERAAREPGVQGDGERV